MKNIGTIAVVALFGALTFASCKKDYTCECKVAVEAYTEGDSSAWITVEAQDTIINYSYEGVSKTDAKTNCDGSQQTLSANYNEFFGDHASVNCDLN